MKNGTGAAKLPFRFCECEVSWAFVDVEHVPYVEFMPSKLGVYGSTKGGALRSNARRTHLRAIACEPFSEEQVEATSA